MLWGLGITQLFHPVLQLPQTLVFPIVGRLPQDVRCVRHIRFGLVQIPLGDAKAQALAQIVHMGEKFGQLSRHLRGLGRIVPHGAAHVIQEPGNRIDKAPFRPGQRHRQAFRPLTGTVLGHRKNRYLLSGQSHLLTADADFHLGRTRQG